MSDQYGEAEQYQKYLLQERLLNAHQKQLRVMQKKSKKKILNRQSETMRAASCDLCIIAFYFGLGFLTAAILTFFI